MRRREFLALVGGAALSRPRSARAQPAMPVIGFLDTSADTGAKLSSFYDGLKTEGFVRNQNVAVDYRAAAADPRRLAELAADLVNRKVAMIAAAGIPAALAARTATTTIPIVFAVGSDPVKIGLVESLNRPGGNITGVTALAVELEQKRIELLHELIPAAKSFALLINSTNPNAETQKSDALTAAGKMGLKLDVLNANTERDFDSVFAALTELRAGGLVISNDGLFIALSRELAALSLRNGVPTIHQYREFTAAGGLMSYGANQVEFYHQAGAYSGLILRGANAADLPVYQVTRVQLIVNLKTAKSLALTVPLTLLGRADEVIE